MSDYVETSKTFSIQPIGEKELKEMGLSRELNVLMNQVIARAPHILDEINKYLVNAVLTEIDQSKILSMVNYDPDTEMSATTLNHVKFFRELIEVFKKENMVTQLIAVLQIILRITQKNQEDENLGKIMILNVGEQPKEAEVRETGTFAAV